MAIMNKRQILKLTLFEETVTVRKTFLMLESCLDDFQQCPTSDKGRTNSHLRILMEKGYLRMDGYILSPKEVVRLGGTKQNKSYVLGVLFYTYLVDSSYVFLMSIFMWYYYL